MSNGMKLVSSSAAAPADAAVVECLMSTLNELARLTRSPWIEIDLNRLTGFRRLISELDRIRDDDDERE